MRYCPVHLGILVLAGTLVAQQDPAPAAPAVSEQQSQSWRKAEEAKAAGRRDHEGGAVTVSRPHGRK